MNTYETQTVLNKKFRLGSPIFSEPKVNQILEKFQELGYVSPIVPEDRELYQTFFRLEAAENPSCYGNSWAYLTQAANGLHLSSPRYHLGLKYCDDRLLVTAGFFPRPIAQDKTSHFHFIRPMGAWRRHEFQQLCQKAWELSKTPVYIKKLTEEQFSYFDDTRGFKRVEEYPWHEMAFAEDDTYPEIKLEINYTLSHLQSRGENELKDKFHRFKKRHTVQIVDYTVAMKNEAMQIVKNFFEHKNKRILELSTPDDYCNMLSCLPSGKNGEDYFAALFQVDGRWAGFYLAEKLQPGIAAGVHANMALYQEFPYLSEYVILQLCQRLQNAGIKIANLGGSETPGLHEFKMKFRPPSLSGQRKSHWLVYVGN